jgi:hypothetical protein
MIVECVVAESSRECVDLFSDCGIVGVSRKSRVAHTSPLSCLLPYLCFCWICQETSLNRRGNSELDEL